ncbi:MAG: DUF1553 domain-containing protein, partial [Acidobacteria bacterium]|nr:DUF1553 domain-containing protein [Acidobacteriota bacterium]
RRDKRDRKIEELLAAPAFNDKWTLWFGDVVENVKTATNAPLYYPGRNAYYEWIRTSIAAGKPYDEMVRELLSGMGDNVLNPAASYVARQRQSNGPIQDSFDNLVTHSTDKFLGVPTLCISCHDGAGHTDAVNLHLASRKREQFWSMAAYFAQVRWATQTVDAASGNIRWNITQNPGGTYQLNTTTGNKSPRTPPPGKPATAPLAFLWSNGTGDLPRAGETPQQAYARMLTGQRQFAVAAANLLWREMFGLGLVEPVDGFDLARLDPQNPPPVPWVLQPSHPELLDQLARHFESGRYDLRAFLRTLARSSAYQLSRRYTAGKWNESWTPLFARHYAKRLPAEVLFDALTRATNQPTTGNQMTAQGLPNPAKAVALPDPTEGGSVARFLTVFGRGNRDGIPRTEEGSILQALALLNDSTVYSRVRNTGTTTVANTLKATQKPEEITDALYLATLGRSPTSSERSTAVAHLKGGTLSQRTEDLHYALLNSLEFAFN